MSQQLNFAEIKQRISVVKGAKMLGLTLTEDGQTLRCACPVCEGDNRTLSLLEEANTFKCFKSGKYGSVLDLVCHVKGVGLREAGQWLNEQENEEWLDEYEDADPHDPSPPVVLKPLEKLPKLDSSHEAVKTLGINLDVASEVGIGFCGRGILRGTVGIPLYHGGHIIGYLGIKAGTEVIVPKNLRG